jgi:EPS-associated MarR family transcriptional regulator
VKKHLEEEYRLLNLVERRSNWTQRELADTLGVSLGKANYVLSALVERGLVKSGNFARSSNKLGYAYLLTPKGIKQKAVITRLFLKRKVAEYDQLSEEIERLRRELE